MITLILAAGYATRLYPLTLDQPKPLLPIRGRPLLDHLVDDLETFGVEELWLVSNHRFAESFRKWTKTLPKKTKARVVDDGSETPETRLGAIGDLALVLERFGIPPEGLFVCAADNIIRFPLSQVASAYKKRGASTIVILEEKDPERLKRTGVVTLSEEGRVMSFEEKPRHPKSNLISPAFYFLSAKALRRAGEYLAEPGTNKDAPGNFIAWLAKNDEVYGEKLQGSRIDIGCLEEYEAHR